MIPAYNAESCLQATLESVLAQTWPADEIIVIDDGSKDSTEVIALSFRDRIRYIKQQNGGIAAARNAGIQAATSEWIAFLDHDDLMQPNKLEEQVRVIDAENRRRSDGKTCSPLVVIYSAFDFLYIDGSTRRVPAFPASQLWPALRYRTPILPSTSIIRRSALLEIGGFHKVYCIDDWNLWFRLIRRFSPEAFQEIPQSLTLYRWWDNNESKNFMPVQEAVLDMLDNLLLEDLTGFRLWLWRRRVQARIYYGLALSLRGAGSDRYWEYAIESMLLWPFPGEIITIYRYKVFAHMLITRLRKFRFSFRYWWPYRQCREDMRMPTPVTPQVGQTT